MEKFRPRNKILPFLIENYLVTLYDDVEKLKNVLDHLDILDSIDIRKFGDVLNISAQNLVNKWKNQSKILRTEVMYSIIPDYPDDVLEKSILLDAMINLLDDMYDENLTKEDVGLYVIELIRLLSNINRQKLSDIEREKISEYFIKILGIAIVESKYRDKIKNSNHFSEVIKYSIECYDCKSMDFDIFIELPLLKMDVNPRVQDHIVSLGEVYRAISIILKDIKDIEHDTQNNIETPIVILSRSKNISLQNYVDALIRRYRQKASENPLEKASEIESSIINNIQRLIQSTLNDYENIFQI